MPELPEIQTVSNALSPVLTHQKITRIIQHRTGLRHPFPQLNHLHGETITSVTRRSKYLLIDTPKGTLVIHLGMSGSIRLTQPGEPLKKHDHWELHTKSCCLRLNDPRRFGAVLFQPKNTTLPQLDVLGPEPLEKKFTGTVLKKRIEGKTSPIKSVIMDASVVVGVGNIYATDSLFEAKIHPKTPANALSLIQCNTLVGCIKKVLNKSIKLGGSTLRDFKGVDGSYGSYASKTRVYGKSGKPCPVCVTVLVSERIGGRNTTLCPTCQVLQPPATPSKATPTKKPSKKAKTKGA